MPAQILSTRTAPETIKKLRNVLDRSQMLIWTSNTDHLITYLNPTIASCLSPSETVDFKAWMQFMHPDDVARVSAVFAVAYNSKTEYQVEYRILRSNGAVRWMLDTGAPQFSPVGEWMGYHGSIVDVTSRYDALQALAKSEETHRLLMENSWDVISHHASCGEVRYVSPSSSRILGFSPDELLGTNVYDYIHPDDIVRMREQVDAQPTGETDIVLLEFRHRHKDGHYVWMSAQSKVLRDPVSKEKVGTISVSRDITFQHQAAEELRMREERFRSLTNLSSDWYWETDAEGRFTYISEGLERLFGTKREDVLGRTRVDRAADAHQAGLQEYLNKVSRREPFRNIHYSVFVPEKNTVRHSAISGEPVVVDGEFKGYRGIGRDITEEIKIAERITHLAEENKALIDNSLDIIALVDEDGRLMRINGAVTDILGFQPEEMVGHGYTEYLDPRELPVVSTVEKELRHGKNEVQDFETCWIRKNGTPVQLALGIRWSQVQRKMYITARDITESKQTQARLEQLATHDTLTDLPNRALLNHRLGSMLLHSHPNESIAVMFIDLDQFKAVNDSLGHSSGDKLLQLVASRLNAHIRPKDFVARLGGDEFVVVANCLEGRKSAEIIAKRLLDTLAAPLNVDGHEVVVGASIGISVYPQDGQTHDALVQCADTAMYRAKAAGRNCYRFFEAVMTVEAKRRLTLESALRHALERNEFELYYQPRINLKDMSVVGMEALLRWNHPELGRVSPMDFIPIAEERGLIISIGKWVLEKACLEARRLNDKFGRPFRMAVNLSARQLQSRDLVKQVAYCLVKADLPAHLLELELTESALIDDLELSARVLADLKTLGIALAVDDFGTGYSSLAYLQRFPLDILKLDKAFINRQNDNTENIRFIKAFLGLAHALNMSVVAEGVETVETLHLLRSSACDEGQGFLFAQPLPIGELESFLTTTTQEGQWKCGSMVDCLYGSLMLPEPDPAILQQVCAKAVA